MRRDGGSGGAGESTGSVGRESQRLARRLLIARRRFLGRWTWESCADIVRAAVDEVSAKRPSHRLMIQVPPGSVLIPADNAAPCAASSAQQPA